MNDVKDLIGKQVVFSDQEIEHIMYHKRRDTTLYERRDGQKDSKQRNRQRAMGDLAEIALERLGYEQSHSERHEADNVHNGVKLHSKSYNVESSFPPSAVLQRTAIHHYKKEGGYLVLSMWNDPVITIMGIHPIEEIDDILTEMEKQSLRKTKQAVHLVDMKWTIYNKEN